MNPFSRKEYEEENYSPFTDKSISFTQRFGMFVKPLVEKAKENMANVNKQFDFRTQAGESQEAWSQRISENVLSFTPVGLAKVGKNVPKMIRSFVEMHADDQKFLSEFADAIKSKVNVPEDVFNRAKDTLASYGFNVPTAKTKLADFISTARDAADQKLFDSLLDSNLVKRFTQDNSPVSKLISAIKSAGSPQKGLEAAQTAERAKRAKEVEQIFSQGKGMEGYKQALGALKGELASKPKFDVLKIDEKDVKSLANEIQSHPILDVFDKISATHGLDKLFKGQLPQPSQLALLEEVFGSDLVKAVMSKRPVIDKVKDAVTELVNVPRIFKTVLDMSAVLRQGVLFSTTKPTATVGAVKEMLRQTFSPENFKGWLQELPKHPLYREMKDSGLYLADPTKIAGGLTAKEEAFMTNFAQKIPMIGAIVRASERSYVSFLNKLRVDVFTQLATKFGKEGLATPENLRSLANFVNNATGRGSLGKFERVAQELNNVFFSPRLVAARFNMLNPIWYAKQTAPVRKEAIKTMAEFIGVGSSILAIAAAAGADVELDSRSTDFGKIRVGNTRWDIWGGFQQWVRVMSQVITKERKTVGGDIYPIDPAKFPFESRLDVAETFLKGKLAPVPALIVELLEGQNMFGEQTTFGREMAELVTPLYLQDIGEAVREMGPEALFTAGAPGFFGVGVQTYGNDTPATKNPFSR